MATDLHHLQQLLARLADRAARIRAADPQLARDLDLLQVHLQESGRDLVAYRERTRVIAAAMLALEASAAHQLNVLFRMSPSGGSAGGPLMLSTTRAMLEEFVTEGLPFPLGDGDGDATEEPSVIPEVTIQAVRKLERVGAAFMAGVDLCPHGNVESDCAGCSGFRGKQP